MSLHNTLRHAACRIALFGALLTSCHTAQALGCSISSSGMAFGPYQPLTLSGKLASTAATSNAAVSIVCSGIGGGTVSNNGYVLTLGASTVGSGDRILNRAMSNSGGGDNMLFNIYREPSLTSVWGDGTSGSVLSGVVPNGSVVLTVYGMINAGQATLKAGNFSTSMTMTITYVP